MKYLSKLQVEDVFFVMVYFGIPFVAYTLREAGLLGSLFFLAALYALSIAVHIKLSRKKRDLAQAKSNLFAIERIHYIESHVHEIARDLMSTEQYTEYSRITREKHISDFHIYQYQEFDPQEYERTAK